MDEVIRIASVYFSSRIHAAKTCSWVVLGFLEETSVER